MLPVIQIGPVTIQSLVLASIVALWLGTTAAERACRQRALDPNDAWNVVALALAVTFFSARLVFVLQNLPVYAGDWRQAFSPTPNALSLDYGAIFGLVAGYAYIQRRAIPLAPFADALAPGALVALAVIACGQFLSGDGYGMPTKIAWGIFIWGEPRHPVQLYDAFAALAGLALIGWLARRTVRAGGIALGALAWYSAARVFLDAFRADVAVLDNGYRVTQVIALIVLLLALSRLTRGQTHSPGG